MSSLRFISLFILASILGPEILRASEDKLVIAHYMTLMLPKTDRKLRSAINPELSDPNGSTKALGGISQTVPLASLYLKDADLTAAVDFEIRAARQLGIDGFQFFYPGIDHPKTLKSFYNPIIREFLRLSETKYPGFKVSVCLCNPTSSEPLSEAEKTELWADPLRDLLKDVESSPAWLRAPGSEAILFYLWVGDSLAEGVKHRANTPAQLQLVSQAYARLSERVEVPIDYVYHVRRQVIDDLYINQMLDSFPAVWGWTDSEEHSVFWDHLARRCRERNVLYTQTVYPDYYTSKVYAKDDVHHDILPTKQALELGIDQIERHYRVTNLAQTQIQLYKDAIRRKALWKISKTLLTRSPTSGS